MNLEFPPREEDESVGSVESVESSNHRPRSRFEKANCLLDEVEAVDWADGRRRKSRLDDNGGDRNEVGSNGDDSRAVKRDEIAELPPARCVSLRWSCPTDVLETFDDDDTVEGRDRTE
jgi:hypothetical protein